MAVSEPNDEKRACSLARRAGAMMYDTLILVAVWMVGTALVVVTTDKPVVSGNPLFQAYLLALAFAYFHVSWSRIGQTLGMRAWRVWLDPGRARFTLAQSLKRFLAGLASLLSLGLGFAWGLTRGDRRAWPDLASDSRLVVRPANAVPPRSAAQQKQPEQAE